MNIFARRHVLPAALAAATLAACAPAKEVVVAPPPPPPPPPVVVIPPPPVPPPGASPNLAMPLLGINGNYVHINAANTPNQATWNFRAAYNVAALNCMQPQHAQIVVNYRAFLTRHATGLSAANRGVDADFRKLYGTGFVRQREEYMTRVYNFYALPPTVADFCDVALAVSYEAAAITPQQLSTFAAGALPRFDAVFEDFYRRYAQYRTELAAWNAQYYPQPPALVLPMTPGSPAIVLPAAPGTAYPSTASLAPPAPGAVSPSPALPGAASLAPESPGPVVSSPVVSSPAASSQAIVLPAAPPTGPDVVMPAASAGGPIVLPPVAASPPPEQPTAPAAVPVFSRPQYGPPNQ